MRLAIRPVKNGWVLGVGRKISVFTNEPLFGDVGRVTVRLLCQKRRNELQFVQEETAGANQHSPKSLR